MLYITFTSTKNRTLSYDYCPLEFTDNDSPTGMKLSTWRRENENSEGFQPIGCSASSNNYSQNAKKIREEFTEYFNDEWAVEWQWQAVNRTNIQYCYNHYYKVCI